MKVKDALEILNDLPLEAEICAQWYEKDDIEKDGLPISDEVWTIANRILDKLDLSDMRYQVEDAVIMAQERLKTGEIK
jgi:hypothetical protein